MKYLILILIIALGSCNLSNSDSKLRTDTCKLVNDRWITQPSNREYKHQRFTYLIYVDSNYQIPKQYKILYCDYSKKYAVKYSDTYDTYYGKDTITFYLTYRGFLNGCVSFCDLGIETQFDNIYDAKLLIRKHVEQCREAIAEREKVQENANEELKKHCY